MTGKTAVARTLNKVMLIGFVGREPELRYTPAGKAVATFSLAVPRVWEAPDGQLRTATEWFNIVAWRVLAELCHAALRPETHVYVEGALQTRTWQDAQGQPQARTEVVASEILVLDAETSSHAADPSGVGASRPPQGLTNEGFEKKEEGEST